MDGINREQSERLKEIGMRAVQVKYELQSLTTKQKNSALLRVAEGLKADAQTILKANEQDMRKGKERGMHEGLLDRLKLTDARILAMAEGLCQVAGLSDPVDSDRAFHPSKRYGNIAGACTSRSHRYHL